MISPNEVKLILNIDDDELEDSALDQYITRYTKVIMSKLGDWAKLDTSLYNDPLFEECLLAIIACQLSRTDVGMIHAPSEYKVGDTTLKYNNTSMGLYGAIPSWCDYYNSLLSALLGRKSELQKVRPLRRHGMACHPKWWHI